MGQTDRVNELWRERGDNVRRLIVELLRVAGADGVRRKDLVEALSAHLDRSMSTFTLQAHLRELEARGYVIDRSTWGLWRLAAEPWPGDGPTAMSPDAVGEKRAP